MASKRPAFRENIHRLFDEAQATDLAPGIVSLIESRATQAQLREIPVTKILPNPAQPDNGQGGQGDRNNGSHA